MVDTLSQTYIFEERLVECIMSYLMLIQNIYLDVPPRRMATLLLVHVKVLHCFYHNVIVWFIKI